MYGGLRGSEDCVQFWVEIMLCRSIGIEECRFFI
jgi:hypothetical protein